MSERNDLPPPQAPGEFIKAEMEARGWTQRDLARVLNRPLPTINEVIQGKKAIMPELAIELGMAFDTGPEVWVQREAMYRLSLAERPADDSVSRRARLHALAPIKEMEKRQWIKPTETIDELEREVMKFFGTKSLSETPAISAATRRSGSQDDLTPTQRAWCFRVRQMGSAILAAEYRDENFPGCIKELRKLAAYPAETHKISKVLSEHGIRLVVVEPLSGCKVDGVALWLDASSPVIGLSLRYDRSDALWFTLCHELSHIHHRDESSVDSDVSGGMMLPMDVKPPMERRADEEAAAMLIPPEELASFIRRVGPLYSKVRINQFAHKLKIHPGIIVGQLQHRGEIGYHANREMLVKIRHTVTPATLTDGWGHSIDPRSFQ